ncbi:BTAD domain-containing putative transcriptional regulator [Herbiconiux sp. P17]|uniref:AfsR/SARP family transcriptional regulator n=1 Tax=Herbiconiux wuyangfengii TaxID=3342794 RepID=UPI0035B7D4ED
MSERSVAEGPAPVRVAVLGAVAVRTGSGGFVEPAGHRAKALLAALALAAPHPLSAQRLVDDIWQDEPPRGARAALQTQVSRIRSAFGDDLIESLPSGYRLAVATDDVDLTLAESLLLAARAHLAEHRPAEASAVARSAISLWRGDPGADLDAESLATALSERADRALDGLETTLATTALALGQALDAEALARRLCQRSPFDDSAHLLLMRTLDALGRSTEAVGVYATFRERVQDAFGTSPALELQSLHLELLARDDPTAAAPSTSAYATDQAAATAPTTSLATAAPPTIPPATALPTAPTAATAPPAATATTAAPATSTTTTTTTGAPAQLATAALPALPPARRATVARGIRAAPNALIGRDDALVEIEHLLATSRVTTVLGAGGLGKTRVAHELASRALTRFGAVIVVELASVRSADDVVFALASALGIREVASSKRIGDRVVRDDLRGRIVARLADTPTFLVLDNCEHIIDAAAEWSSALTAELPDLTILTTSRTPLAISSERVFALAPLGASSIPAGERASAQDAMARDTRAHHRARPEDDAAVRLFVDRATAARPGAALPLDTVARLCARLDGLPLAIELAAARIRSMSIDEIERRLSNRFALLSGGDRAAPERHRTLLAVIEWSWNLLDTAEQRALSRLSEFADGFSADAAQAVVGCGVDDVTDLLDGLVAQSLVMMRETDAGVRYRMLETVREFGQLQLDAAGTRDEVRDAVFEWADAFAHDLHRRTDGAEQVATFAKVAVEEDNLIDVLRRAIDGERADIVVSVFALLGYYWSLRSAHSEVLAFSKPVYESLREYEPEDDRVDSLVAVLLIISMTTMITELRFAVRPRSRLRKVVATRDVHDPRLRAMTSLILNAGSLERAAENIQHAISSDDRGTALLGSLIGSIAAENEGRRDAAVTLARSAARIADSLDDTWGGAMAGQMLGALHSQSAEPEEALRWARKAKIGLTKLGATEDIRQIEWTIATNDIAVGNLDEAAELFARLVESPGQADGIEVASIGLAGQAEVLRARGRVEEARESMRQALATFDVPRTRSSPWFRITISAMLSALVIDDTGSAEERRLLARRLRSRTLASLRTSIGMIDRPVLGASVIGLAVWAEDSEAVDPRIGLELLALAEAMGARQDPPALHLRALFERFGRRFPADEIAAARAAATDVPHEERPERVATLLRAPGPWSWAWTA